MPHNRIRERLQRMSDAIRAIERIAAGKALADYTAGPDMAAAIERYIERLSEASGHVPDALKQQHPTVDWRGVADIGNVLRHAYDQIIDRRIWQIVTDDLAPLRRAVEAMLAEVDRRGENS
jgi:uncharacterized protein with HEPN domain